MSEYDDIERGLRDFDQAYEKAEEIERREFKVGLLSEAKKFLAIAVDAGRKGDLSTAKLNRYLCEEYLKMAKDS
jgi:hypothetical protein